MTVRIQSAPQATIKIKAEKKTSRSKSAASMATFSNNLFTTKEPLRLVKNHVSKIEHAEE